jgi:AmmeMemoRadiSam system protein A
MGRIISSYIFPHPPVIIPEVGKGEEQGAINTVNAALKASMEIKKERPSTIILSSPHAPLFEDYIYISDEEVLKGSMGRFGREDVSLSFKNNVHLAEKITMYAKQEGISAGGIEIGLVKKYQILKELDHGAFVPLYYINREYGDFKLVHMSMSTLTNDELYRFGMCVRRAVQDSDEEVVFVASGDLSHRLTHDGPYGYSKHGLEFDRLVIDSIKENNIDRLLDIDEGLCESAGECGLKSFLIMLGALDGYEIKPDVYSYEGPFGVGYSIIRFGIGKVNPERKVLEARSKRLRKSDDPYVALAKKSLESYVRENKVLEVPDGVPNEMKNDKAGAFVSLKKNGQLRGCIGTIAPTCKNIAQEIIRNAICSGTEDPRFNPVRHDELDSLVYSVDILMEPEPIDSIDELDVVKYGVIVRAGHRSGLLLPNLEGVDTPEEQVSIALQKAGIRSDEGYKMERFEVIRHK